MAETVASGLTLSDSQFKSRPDTKLFYYMDANAGLNSIQDYKLRKLNRQMKFPSLRNDKDSIKKPDSPAFSKPGVNGDNQSPTPFRDYENIVDPTCGFLSAGADVDRQTGVSKIKSFTVSGGEPQNRAPQEVHSIRKSMQAAPPETQRLTEKDPPAPENWQSRLKSACHTRADLGGWTSEKDPREDHPNAKMQLSNAFPTFKRVKSAPMSDRDKLAYKYIYTSSTQSAYEDIPFDAMLRYKRWPPVSTLEACADPVGRRPFLDKFHPPTSTWRKKSIRDWDSAQLRRDFYNQTRPYTSCTPNPRGFQIPGYSGCVGAEDPQEIDNPHTKPFVPFTVKRNPIPKWAYTSARPHIPGYTGCYRTCPTASELATAEANANASGRSDAVAQQIAAATASNIEDHKRDAPLSNMVTTVAPNNPCKVAHAQP